MPLSDGTPVYVLYAIAGPDGLIRRTGRSEEATVGMLGVEPDDIIIANTSDPVIGVIDVEVTPIIGDETHYWDGVAFQQLPAKPPGTSYWDGDAEDWVSIPDQPNVYTVFDEDAGVWVDTRDPAQIAVDLHQARYQSNIDMPVMFLRAAGAGAYPYSELADDSSSLPQTVEDYVHSVPPEQQDFLKSELKYGTWVWRFNPHIVGDPDNGIQGFIPWLAAERGIVITDAQLDEIWEVPVPPPLYVAPSGG